MTGAGHGFNLDVRRVRILPGVAAIVGGHHVVNSPAVLAVLHGQQNVDVAEFLLAVTDDHFGILDLIPVSKLEGLQDRPKSEEQ